MGDLHFTHNALLVFMACLVALVAGFTGLSMTRDLSTKALVDKRASIALASVALGGGIWAMHFIGMLGLQLPILFYYDAAITLVSALAAILIAGGALILLHFTQRTPVMLTLAGTVLGIGILVMHYIGMAGLELCRALYTPTGVLVSSVLAVGLCVLAVWVAYGERTNRNILLGTLVFAGAVCSVHFLAMAGTRFIAVPGVSEFGPSMSNETLALVVIVFSFVIFGACLWVSVTYLVAPADIAPARSPDVVDSAPADLQVAESAEPGDCVASAPPHLLIPCERDGGKVFVAPRDVSFVRADGHYTQVYTETERLFCVWPVTEAARRLVAEGFVQTHRSYLVNPDRVRRFERTKDKGQVIFSGESLPPAPVSRSKLKATQEVLVSHLGATGAV